MCLVMQEDAILNMSQLQSGIGLIQGPPGTGEHPSGARFVASRQPYPEMSGELYQSNFAPCSLDLVLAN